MLEAHAPQYLPLDSGSRRTIEHAHHEIHEGNHFSFTRSKTMDTVTANTVTITAPASASGFIHLIADIESTGAASWTFSEAPEASAGSALSSYNNKRNSATTDPTTIAGGVVWTSAGTILQTHYIGSTNPRSNLGGVNQGRMEWILNPSTKYGFRVANVAATCYSTINLYYYVED